ncbi:hypothetical protein APED_00495 [Acanthopleuribacter pedis]
MISQKIKKGVTAKGKGCSISTGVKVRRYPGASGRTKVVVRPDALEVKLAG